MGHPVPRPGISTDELRVGMRVTISPNLITRDRSYTNAIHEIVAINDGHIQTKITRWDGSVLLILNLHEHSFYDASTFEEDQ